MKRARLKDIAEKAGCSIAVVSYVVNHSAGNISCSDNLREKILTIADELGYSPHYASRALRNQRAATIGMYMPPQRETGLAGASESAVLSGVERACRELDHDLLVLSANGHECMDKLNTRRIDGLILLNVEDDAEWVFTLPQNGSNIVAINYHGRSQIDTINFDNEAAASLAVRELAAIGHQRLGYIGMLSGVNDIKCKTRFEGFMAGCHAEGIEVFPELVFSAKTGGAEDDPEAAKTISSRILAMPPDKRPTALIGCSDLSVLLVIRELMRNGMRVPEDISAVGIDDSYLCRFFMPEISSVKQPFSQMGEEAARHVISESQKRGASDNETKERTSRWFRLAEPSFIARDSTCSAR